MDQSRKISLLKSILGPVLIDKSMRDELVFQCPKCHHQKPKLSVNYETDEFNCWVCHFKGKSLAGIFALSENRAHLAEYNSTRDRKKPEEKQRCTIVPALPDEFEPLISSKLSFHKNNVMSFLLKRGLTRSDIALYKIGYAESGKHRGRVIIPSFDRNGDLNFFVGRTIYPEEVKYMNGRFEKDIIFNEVMIDWSQPVILTEGPFDAIVAGTNAIPLQGTYARENSLLFKRLVEHRPAVYLALDADARKYRLRLATSLMRYGIQCYDVPLNGKKDLGEMTKKEVQEAVTSAPEIRDELQLMRERLAAIA